MGKIKGYLKKVSGTLKLHMFGIAVATTFLTFAGMIGTLIGMGVSKSNLEDDLKKTDAYKNYIHEQQVELENAYNDGELTLGEYMQSVDELKEGVDVKDLLKQGIINTDDLSKASLEKTDRLTAATIALGSIMLGAGFIPMGVNAALSGKIDDSAKKDLQEAERLLNDVAGAGPEPKQPKQKPQKVKSPVYVEVEVSGEEELKGIDEYYSE